MTCVVYQNENAAARCRHVKEGSGRSSIHLAPGRSTREPESASPFTCLHAQITPNIQPFLYRYMVGICVCVLCR